MFWECVVWMFGVCGCGCFWSVRCVDVGGVWSMCVLCGCVCLGYVCGVDVGVFGVCFV